MARADAGNTRTRHFPSHIWEDEIRHAYAAEEFGEAFSPELREQEERQQEQMKANAQRPAA